MTNLEMKNYIIAFSLLMILSCERQVLDKQPQDAYNEYDIWSSADLAEKYLNTAYPAVGRWGLGASYPYDVRTMSNQYTDECVYLNSGNGAYTFNTGEISPTNLGRGSEADQWTINYSYIRILNVFLDQIHRLNASEEQTNSLKGQAMFLRAQCYAYLLNFYSWWRGENNGVPLLLEPFELGNDFTVKRNSYEDVVSFIVKELDEAQEFLPLEWDDSNWGRVTKGACMALKSRVLLYAASRLHNPESDLDKWKKASDAAKAVIDLGIYKLYPVENWRDYTQIWLEKNNVETIFARPFNKLNLPARWKDQYFWPNGFNGLTASSPTQQLVDEFEMANGLKITDPRSGYSPAQMYKDRELRFHAAITYNGTVFYGREIEQYLPIEDATNVKPGIDSHQSKVLPGFSSPTGYWIRKFMDESTNFEGERSDSPLVLFRLAEIYLNYAESQWYLGNQSESLEYLNKIRRRVKLPERKSIGDQLLEDIKHERRIELVFENNIRWCDERRWEILPETAAIDPKGIQWYKDDSGNLTHKILQVQDRNYYPKMYNFPIPFSEIQKAPFLNQNPGY